MPENDSLPDKIVEYLSEAFHGLLAAEGPKTLESFEDEALALTHSLAARAYGMALERRDLELRASLPEGSRAHDRRRRALSTRLGDVEFRATRCLDRLGLPFCPLLDELDVPHGARVSPSAASLLVELASDVSYARAGRMLARSGGSAVSAGAVMRLMRVAGGLCADEDASLAASLYSDGVLPGGSEESSVLCVEADGTWFNLQGRDRESAARCEVKAVVAYSGKEASGSKASRVGCARHACVAAPSRFSPEAVAALGAKYDLSAVETVHVGCDGEAWCKSLGEWLPKGEAVAHLDPFHVNRALMSCCEDPKMGWQLVDALWDGGKEAVAAMLEACAELGLSRPERSRQVAAYLRNNMGLIDVEGPSLGTMESENQHLYGVRMDSFPCAWSRRGASDMARIRSRTHSGRAIPRQTREGSMTAKRRRRRAERELAALARLAPSSVVKSEGRGWEPPRASVSAFAPEVVFAANLDGGMVAAG